ncbi:MAG: sensor N-terminal transmembrane domain-containing protein [Acidobacteria bacterium]|nr:sensor N-terminal transmembrane domain-containing protein [Acidobacteriota bacterium]MBV9068384.1 sensor N-terminal transmembrane domain-containing protein [Acidobacteriota bacterium]MBV9186140.1 sensor N-terminal transmembrane domain-containing protein [Acidobacteriota bacterium]
MKRIANRIRRFLSRISFRLMAFNLLLVFLPVAGILYLGSYEQKLLGLQRRALQEEARLLAAAVASAPVPGRAAQEILLQRHRLRGNVTESIRLRVISPLGYIVADSHSLSGPPPPQRANRAKRNILYRAGAYLLRPLHLSRTSEQPLAAGDYYERSHRLLGAEVRSALQGDSGAVERISPDRRSVTVYVAEPIRVGDDVIGAALASQSTFPILLDLYTVRLGILRIFIISVIVAIILSWLVATTIVRPLRRLRLEAGAILDRRGRLRGRFRGSRKHDEIGDLSRALERLTRRLDEHVRFIESFAADVSHEFKNPLASIRTATEMLAEVDEQEQRKRFLRMVELEIARMESLLAGVREITMIDAQLTTEVRTRVDVRGLLERIVDGFRMRERASVSIALALPPGPCEVNASEDRLIQVFVNVLENAISFSPAGGVVTITASCDASMIVTTIADQGSGIAGADLPRVFDRFFTHRPEPTRPRASHTGLGLAIVKAIVDGYGGSITPSNNAGGGATFEIRLPAA